MCMYVYVKCNHCHSLTQGLTINLHLYLTLVRGIGTNECIYFLNNLLSFSLHINLEVVITWKFFHYFDTSIMLLSTKFLFYQLWTSVLDLHLLSSPTLIITYNLTYHFSTPSNSFCCSYFLFVIHLDVFCENGLWFFCSF